MAANEADVRERSTAVADRSEAKNWLQANQQYLSAALAEVRVLLQRHINRNKVRSGNADQSESDLPNVSYPDFRGLRPPALEVLSATFKLSTFERALLLLCAGVEFDAGLAALCGEAQGKAHPTNPTFGLALAALPGAHWSALSPAAPLRYWKLIRTETASSSLTQSLLHIDERILHYLAGVQYVDDRLADYLVPVTVTSQPVASHQVLSDQIVSLWSRIPAGGVLPAIQLCGLDAAGKRAVAASACARLKLNLVAIPGDNLPVNTSEVSTLIRLWEREAALQACALLVECDDMDAVNDARAPSVTRLLTTLRAPVLFTRSDRWTPLQRLTVTLDVNKPTLEEQRQLWRETLQGVGEVDAGRLDLLTSQFNLSARTIREAGTEAIGRLAKPVAAKWRLTFASERRSTTSGLLPQRGNEASGSARFSPARAGPGKRWQPKCSPTSCGSIFTASISPPSSVSTSGRPKKTCAGFLTRQTTVASFYFSTKRMPFLANGARSRTHTTDRRKSGKGGGPRVCGVGRLPRPSPASARRPWHAHRTGCHLGRPRTAPATA